MWRLIRSVPLPSSQSLGPSRLISTQPITHHIPRHTNIQTATHVQKSRNALPFTLISQAIISHSTKIPTPSSCLIRASPAQLHQLITHTSDLNSNTTASSSASPSSTIDPSSASASASASPKPKRRTLKTLRYDMIQYLATHFPGFREWSTLVKIELSFVVTMSSFFGCMMAGSDAWSVSHVLANFAGTAMCAASAAIGNQWLEKTHDAKMKRTHQRPLVTGAIPEWKALTAAALLPIAGGALLHYASEGDWVAPALGLGTIFAYVCIYTPMKRIHRWNTELGAIVGSVPVLIGWSCAISHYSHYMSTVNHLLLPFTTSQSLLMPHALYGFLFLVAWQMQHFMTIAYQYQDQYSKAGYVMMTGMPALHKGMAWTAVLCAMPFGAVYFGVASQMLLITGSAINGLLVWTYAKWWKVMKSTTDEGERNKAARSCMKWGIIYFLLMFSATIYHALDNKYHLFTNLVPISVREAAFLLCPVAWSQTNPMPSQAIAVAPIMKPIIEEKLVKNDSQCVYMRLVHPDTLKALHPKPTEATTSQPQP